MKYREAIHAILDEYHALFTERQQTCVETEVVCDDIHGQYMLMRVGWRGDTRVRRALFYLRLKNEKDWIEEDWTKEGIACELECAGVPRDDIVLAFQAPEVRSETAYAAA